ncbi:hypothetical protein ACQZ5N_00980 [Agrobacterium sp. 22-221-1]
MSRIKRTPRNTPQSALLSATAAAELLGVGRTRFWQLRKEFKLERVPWSRDTRPLYRREDVLALAVPQGVQVEPAVDPKPDPKKQLAIDAGFKVAPGFEHITVAEWHEANGLAERMKNSAHLRELE